MIRTIALLGATSLLLAACQDQAALAAPGATGSAWSDSSTVYPFTTLVAEQFVAANPACPRR